MSVKDLREYGLRCAKDPNYGARAKEIGIRNLDGQIEHGASMGLTFNLEDFKQLTAAVQREIERLEVAPQELSKEELEEISAFIVTTTAAVVGSAVVGASAAVVGAGAAVAASTSGSGW